MSEKKELATTLWENLNEGLDSLYQKYRSLKETESSSYRDRISALDGQYQALKNSAAAQSRVAQANLDLSLAEKGLGASGESVRRGALTGAALQENLTQIDLKKQQSKNELESEKSAALSKLDAEESEAVSDYVYRMNESYFDQLNRDREMALNEEKLRITKEQNAFERDYKERELELKREQEAFSQKIESALNEAKVAYYNAKSTSTKSSSASASSSTALGVGGSKLESIASGSVYPESYNARQIVSDILSNNSDTDFSGNQYYDTEKINKAIRDLMNDTTLDKQYRYEIYLYAKALGFEV